MEFGLLASINAAFFRSKIALQEVIFQLYMGRRLGKILGGVNPNFPTKKTFLQPNLPMKKAFLAFQHQLPLTVYCKFTES